jgi:hypothetical protein
MLQIASISQLTVSTLYRQCGILDISKPCRIPWPVTRFTFHTFSLPQLNLLSAYVYILSLKLIRLVLSLTIDNVCILLVTQITQASVLI